MQLVPYSAYDLSSTASLSILEDVSGFSNCPVFFLYWLVLVRSTPILPLRRCHESASFFFGTHLQRVGSNVFLTLSL